MVKLNKGYYVSLILIDSRYQQVGKSTYNNYYTFNSNFMNSIYAIFISTRLASKLPSRTVIWNI